MDKSRFQIKTNYNLKQQQQNGNEPHVLCHEMLNKSMNHSDICKTSARNLLFMFFSSTWWHGSIKYEAEEVRPGRLSQIEVVESDLRHHDGFNFDTMQLYISFFFLFAGSDWISF